MDTTGDIRTGNANQDAIRGWIVGSFIADSEGLRRTEDVEIKWGVHAVGEEQREWVTSEVRTTIAILISGQLEILFRDQTVLLSKPGDYVMWGKGTDHSRRVTHDCTIITIRWPSIKQS